MIHKLLSHSPKYLTLLVLMALGCSQTPESGLQTIKIPDGSDPELNLADMVKSVKLVQLETNKKVLLGYIKDVKLHNEKLYLVELNKISVFDPDGNFINTLGKQGEGPGEYSRVSSMAIDTESDLIYVTSGRKLLVYSTDFNLVEEKVFPMLIQYISTVNQKPLIVSEEIGVQVADGFANQTNLYELSHSLEITDSIPVRTVMLDAISVGGFFYKYYLSNIEEGLYLYKPVLTPENILCDTLYQVKDKELIPFVKFHFERPQSLDETGYQTTLIYNIVNSSSYMICEYDQDWERMLFLYDKIIPLGIT